VVEESDEKDMLGGGVNSSNAGASTQMSMGDQTTILGDLKNEDEKLTEALLISLTEITTAKQDKKEAAQADA
jgi:hypothetical protein